MSLVKVPWQPGLLVHEDLLVKLRQIEKRLGRPPLLYGPLSGWRSYAEQEALYEAFLAGKGNPASNPDTGNRTHMRGVAADLLDISPTMQRACIAVGLQRDAAEAWHWQLRTWRDYPIIPKLENESDTDMAKIIHDRQTGQYWLVDTIDYLEISSKVALKLYPTFGNAIVIDTDERIQTLRVIDILRDQRKKDFGAAAVAPVDARELAEAVAEELQDDFSRIPTADENAAAARKAIVASP